ncbi:MAG: DHA2 family efflux MFS transporter permease subunit, partial [Actinomycetales bacterium]
RRVMLAGIGVFTIGSIAAALSTSSEALIAARALQGLGGAAIMPLSLTLLASAVPASRRAVAIGVWGGVSGLGVALGPVIGGAVVEGISWQAIFWINVPVAVVAVPLLLRGLGESRSSAPSRLDPVGTLALGGAVLAGIWGIVHGNDDGWSSAGVIGTLVLSVVLLVGYVAWATRRPDAVLPLRLFRSRSFTVANVIALTFTIGMFGTVFLLSQYLQVVQGYSPFEAGLRTLPWTAAPMVVAPLAGALAERVGLRPLLVVGLVMQTVSLVWFAIITEASADYSSFVAPLLVAGVGMGMTFAPMSTAVLDGLPDDDFAIASSANSTVREFGVALGIAGLVAVFQGQGGEITPTGYDGAIGPALLTGAAVVGVAVVAALFAPRRAAAAS